MLQELKLCFPPLLKIMPTDKSTFFLQESYRGFFCFIVCLFYLGFIFLLEFMSWFLLSGLEICFCHYFFKYRFYQTSLSCLSETLVEHIFSLYHYVSYTFLQILHGIMKLKTKKKGTFSKVYINNFRNSK